MPFKEEITAGRQRWGLLSFYQKFEHAVILVLTALIAIVVALAVWNLVLKVLLSIMSSGGFDPTDYAVFQALFGMIFTVIIALEFKRSLLVVAERQHSVVQVRTVVLIAAGARACGHDSGARRRVLARSRSGQPRAHQESVLKLEPSVPICASLMKI